MALEETLQATSEALAEVTTELPFDANDLLQLSENASVGEKLTFTLQVTLVGMGTVFAVLILLWFILTIFGRVSQYFSAKPQASSEIVEPVVVVQEQKPLTETVVKDMPETNEEELIAVITAAISAATQKPASGFRVTSFKKRGNW
jgi:sodium pump decarboxylase gamma subunit